MSDLEKENLSSRRLKLHQKFHKEILRWLRQAFKWSGLITACKAKYRLKRGVYNCGYCGDELGPKEFEIDHEEPCIEIKENRLTGYNYNGIIERMFDADNLVLTCKPCHRIKTGRENSKRKKGVPNTKTHKKNQTKSWTTERRKKAGIRRGKKVLCVTTGEQFYSTGEAEFSTGVDRTSIIKVCNGQRITAGGCEWRWDE